MLNICLFRIILFSKSNLVSHNENIAALTDTQYQVVIENITNQEQGKPAQSLQSN